LTGGQTARGSGSEALLTGARIGILIDRWEPARGGGEAALFALAQRLSSEGAELTIFAERADTTGLPPNASWTPVRSQGLTRSRREASLAHALVDAARTANMELLIGTRHLAELDLYWPHGGSYEVSLRARRESRGQALESTPRGRHKLFLELERELLTGGARRIACVSELVERELALAYPACADRLVTIPNAVDLDRFHPRERLGDAGSGRALRRELDVPEERPLVVFSAREPKLKGLPQLLRALGARTALDFTLLVAGVRRPESWRRLSRKLGLEARTLFLAEADPVALSSAADLCVLPTWRDTSSLVILECLASGTPVLTTERAGAANLIREHEVGTVLADPGDTDALRQALEARLAGFAPAGLAARERVRSSVREHGREEWLDALVAEVVALRS